jgi:glutathione S-transferase
MALKLIIGNKNYSSWSFRPWLAMRQTGQDFAEEVVPLHEPGSRDRILSYSPAGKVPILIDGDITVWESLAILEHLAERFPAAGLWPKDAKARAHARAIAGGGREHRARAGDLDRLPQPLRCRRPVPVRLIQRRRRHVCARRLAL